MDAVLLHCVLPGSALTVSVTCFRAAWADVIKVWSTLDVAILAAALEHLTKVARTCLPQQEVDAPSLAGVLGSNWASHGRHGAWTLSWPPPRTDKVILFKSSCTKLQYRPSIVGAPGPITSF
ncbi:hypothetical protein EXIGLDRAFT_734239 [Exidia glandulosa HHB12029]|uniref:Uncharacterized protein n=1 Tax=Exidia glandulosa HHB12029 TaxID=1314781 RepID=A0A166AX63_EXIGL|nr:hypothetical protein EXIGLDRAFT_734239 [Exidia glandulosa HHB12029]